MLASAPSRAGPAARRGDARHAADADARRRDVGHRHRARRAAGEVLGKSGTAEYGGGDPPPTHAWFVATRGDVAIAVLVEGGESGGRVAAPIAARFFEALG